MGKNKKQKQKQKQTPQLQPSERLLLSFDIALDVRQLSGDHSARWARYGAKFEPRWRSFTREYRAEVLVKAMPPWKDKENRNYVPEWDVDKMAEDPDVVLAMLRHRATAKLSEQALEGPGDGPGDLDITERENEDEIARAVRFPKSYMSLCDGDGYGAAYKAASRSAAEAALVPPGRDPRLCVHLVTGDLLLLRQSCVFELLSGVVMVVWHTDPEEQADPPADPVVPEESFLDLVDSLQAPTAATFESALRKARDYQQETFWKYDFLSLEAGALKGKVSHWVFSDPGQVLNESQKRNNLPSDKDLGVALFQVVHDARRHFAFWDYLSTVMPLLRGLGAEDERREVVLQEMASVCHMGFQRAQGVLKRFLQIRLMIDRRRFLFVKRDGEYDGDGDALVTLAVAMDGLDDVRPPVDPGMRHVVRLCQPETTAEDAPEWLEALRDLCGRDPGGLARQLRAHEADALAELVAILNFVGGLTGAAAMPPVNGRKRIKGLFASRCQRVDRDLVALRGRIDLTLFTVPLVRLEKPEVAEEAVRALNKFCEQETGSSVEGHYHEAVAESLSELKRRCAQARARQKEKEKEKGKGKEKAPAGGPSLFINKPQEKDDEGERPERKEKVKTRPAEGAEAEAGVGPTADPPPPPPPPAPEPEPEKIKVSATTAAVFDVLFDRAQNRRPLAFTALEAAMAELGFEVDSQGGVGSATKFVPPEWLGGQPITLHRPHGTTNKIEGYRLLRASARFRDHFGWGPETFEAA
ncbi:hypothetical protein LX36DRAFT_673622 [Colletotrichum falcatum]|nr:hypothetical protein LX36DRAFT_673622 [Colletotrichum falcatum]